MRMYAVYSCDQHRTHDSMRLITVVDLDNKPEVEKLGKLIKIKEQSVQTPFQLVDMAMKQRIDYLHIAEFKSVKDLKVSELDY